MLVVDLPVDLLALALRFADHHALLRVELACRRLRAVATQFELWRELAQRHLLLDAACQRQRRPVGWKRLALLATRPPQLVERSRLTRVRDCSSVDHENESADNTLRRSQCSVEVEFLRRTVSGGDPRAFLQLAARVQVACGCAHGRPCYWSTTSTWSHKTRDFVEYDLRGGCLLSGVQVVPYRVFWYPGSPTYSPQRVSFELFETQEDGARAEHSVYSSPEFPVVRDMQVQRLPLPTRVFLARGVLRLNLIGRQEDIGVDVQQWMQENNMPPYYICLSYVGATGLLEAADD